MAISRRQFIKRTGLAAAGALVVPNVFRSPFVQKAFADTIGDRYLVVVFLDGGNDGLNTVTPYADGTTGNLRAAYEAARGIGTGGIRLLDTELVPTLIGTCPTTDTPLAIHPGMTGFKSLYEDGRLAVVQGVGYPDYNLSHEQSRFYWQTANPTSLLGYPNGWVGRYLQQAGYIGTDIPAVAVNDEIPPEFRQTVTSVLSTRNLDNLDFPYDSYNNFTDETAKRACFEALYGSAAASPQSSLSYVGNVGSSTLGATDSYSNLADSPLDAQYGGGGLNTSTARDFRQIARVIQAVDSGVPNINARHFQLRNGGYDTHSDQGGADPQAQQYSLHKEVSDAIKLFFDDLDLIGGGIANKVMVMIYSEFSRRIEQNDSGTDHGSQGPMFIISGGLAAAPPNGHVYGSHPDIRGASLDDNGNTVYSQAGGDPYRSTDFRDVYGTILKHWLNIPPATISNFILPTDTIIDPVNYWNTPNFDMGFLP